MISLLLVNFSTLYAEKKLLDYLRRSVKHRELNQIICVPFCYLSENEKIYNTIEDKNAQYELFRSA